ncbi:MFS family permease [Tenggerimyces flavus]|nr:MFS family permease [Tenggerimyces flavus]
MLYPVYALLFADTGLSTSEISSLFVIWSAGALLLEVPLGALADRVSRRKLLAVAAVVRAVGFGLWVFFPSYWAFALGFVLWSVKGALTSGTLEALVYDELAAVGQTSFYTRLLGRSSAAENVGSIVAAAAAIPLMASGSYLLVGLVSMAVCLLQIPVVLSFPETPRVEEVGEEGGIRGYLSTLRSGVGEAVHSPVLRRLVLIAGVVPGLLAFDEYFPLLGREYGIATADIVWLNLVPTLAMIAAALIVARWQPVLIPVLLTTALIVGGALWGSVPGVVAVGLGIGTYHLVQLVLESQVQHAIQGRARATVTGVVGLLAELSAIAVFAWFALGANWLTTALLFLVNGVAILPLGIYATKVMRATRRTDGQSG